MQEILKIIVYSFFAGITVFAGSLLSRGLEKLGKIEFKQELIHTTTAFGGGVLIAAVSFVLVPKGMEKLTLAAVCLIFIAGGLSFYLLDKSIEKIGGRLAQLMAMMLDFIPEAIALGAVFAYNNQLGLLLAIFIGLQNLPEAFNAYRDLRKSGFGTHVCLTFFLPLSFSGILAALAGYTFLINTPRLVSALMLYAAGGIIYLTFQDIAPLAKMKKSWAPPLGATAGFLVGIVGKSLLMH